MNTWRHMYLLVQDWREKNILRWHFHSFIITKRVSLRKPRVRGGMRCPQGLWLVACMLTFQLVPPKFPDFRLGPRNSLLVNVMLQSIIYVHLLTITLHPIIYIYAYIILYLHKRIFLDILHVRYWTVLKDWSFMFDLFPCFN